MAINLLRDRGTPLERQKFTWKDLVGQPVSKLDVDAFTRIRIILMNGIESEALRFSHICSRFSRELREPMARVRRSEQHQQTMVNWLLPADQSPVETTIGYEQVAIEVTGVVAQQEPDPYLAQVYRFGMLEDFDHLYRYSALMDRLYGLDPNNILQSYTDIIPGRPTAEEHRDPHDDLRRHYRREDAKFVSKLNALTIVSGEYQTHDFYMTIGPMFSDPVARRLYAEIASIEEQHVTQYESLLDPDETWLEQWLLHEANEAYNYYSCVETESDPRVKAIWERFLDYELGHLSYVGELFKQIEGRDPAEVIDEKLPDPISYESQRDFVRSVLAQEVNLRTDGTEFVSRDDESERSKSYRSHINSEGSPSEIVAAGYHWRPGTEVASRAQEWAREERKEHKGKGAA